VETINLCRKHGIPFEQCGKLLVATDRVEEKRMHALYERCRRNEVNCSLLNQHELKQLEPEITGLAAVLVSDTGIVDFRRVSEIMAREFTGSGGTIRLNNRVTGIRENDREMIITTAEGEWLSGFVVCCAGLHADRLAGLHGLDVNFRIIPFRGEYYRLSDRLSGLVSHLIYPVPDPELPFLGIHLTRMIDGSITVGPNAVLGWKREGYGKLNFSMDDTLDILAFEGFWKLSMSNMRHGARELVNSLYKKGYLKQVRKYCHRIEIDDLQPHPAGIRAQAVLKDGTLVHDFLFAESKRCLHVCNAPSPAATSAIPIGSYICDRISEKLA
jgi:L-2-hydroxyglutarate oxidase